MEDTSLRDRFRGALLGTAVGDGLGAPFEGRASMHPSDVDRWAAAREPLRWTDDTAMTIAVAGSLAEQGAFDGARMAAAFVDAYDAEPWRGYGSGPPQVFAALRAGAPWDQPARRLFGGSGSFGNGAAMRVAPVGLLLHHRLGELRRAAAASATITHAHVLAQQGAAWQAAAVGWASARTAVEHGHLSDLLEQLRQLAPAAPYQHAATVLRHLVGADPTDVRESVQRHIGTGIAAHEAVPAALAAVLAHPADFGDAVRFAVSLGGDTDTIGAMAGAVSGALLGANAIPLAWRQRAEAHDRLLELADLLLAAHHRLRR